MSENNKNEILTLREAAQIAVIIPYLNMYDEKNELGYLINPVKDKIVASLEAYEDQEFSDEVAAWISEITGVPVRSQEV